MFNSNFAYFQIDLSIDIIFPTPLIL